jgi:hypothetical protein
MFMKTFYTAEDAATPLRRNGYTYSHSTDTQGNIVEMHDPAARNHLFEHDDGPTRQVSYHEGVYYNIPSGTKVVTTLVEDNNAQTFAEDELEAKPKLPKPGTNLYRAKYPGWCTMTSAQRTNARQDRIWAAAQNAKTRFNPSSREEDKIKEEKSSGALPRS